MPLDHQTLVELLESSFSAHAHATANRCMGVDCSFESLDSKSRHLAAYLQGLGLQYPDRVAVMMPNLPQHPIAIAGVIRAGLVLVEMSPLLSSRELSHQLKDCGARAVIVLENFGRCLAEALHGTQVQIIIRSAVGDELGAKGRLITAVVRHIKRQVPRANYGDTRLVGYRSAIAIGTHLRYDRPKRSSDDLALLQYTGGTTGTSKAAMLSHSNIVANLEQASELLAPALQTPPKQGGQFIMVCALPLFHIFALTVCFFMSTRLGFKGLLIPNPRDFKGFTATLQKELVHLFPGVSTLFNALMSQPGWKKVRFPDLRVALGGGMAVSQSVAERWQACTGKPLLEGYGLSETSPVVSATPLDAPGYLGHVGRPLRDTEIRILGDQLEPLPQGSIGEIAVRGPQVMKGYWGKPNESREFFTPDGFFRTGDLGQILEDGSLKIVDRKKEMILVSGYNVYPSEVEQQVQLHPSIQECAVVGHPDPNSGEAVWLYAVKRSEVSKADLFEHCRARLAGYKCPKKIIFLDSLPKSSVGKILKRELGVQPNGPSQ